VPSPCIWGGSGALKSRLSTGGAYEGRSDCHSCSDRRLDSRLSLTWRFHLPETSKHWRTASPGPGDRATKVDGVFPVAWHQPGDWRRPLLARRAVPRSGGASGVGGNREDLSPREFPLHPHPERGLLSHASNRAAHFYWMTSTVELSPRGRCIGGFAVPLW